jgi:hypothetical protein
MPPSPMGEQIPGRLKVLHWNIHSWRDASGAPNVDAVADRAGLVIATNSRDLGHPDGPARPVWALWEPSRATPPQRLRLRLAELPSVDPPRSTTGPLGTCRSATPTTTPASPTPDHAGRSGTGDQPGADWDGGDYWVSL